MGRRASWAAAGAAATVAAIAVGLLIFIHAGGYNVSAAAGHTGIGRWAMATMMRNSVRARAEGEAPNATAAMIRTGAGEYKAMCQHCHGGPGVDRAEWAQGMTPLPPDLAREAREWEPAEIRWIVANGIRMTGMPAFGPTHDDSTIWSIAAFVERLPEMTPEAYAAFPSGHGPEGGAEGHSH